MGCICLQGCELSGSGEMTYWKPLFGLLLAIGIPMRVSSRLSSNPLVASL